MLQWLVVKGARSHAGELNRGLQWHNLRGRGGTPRTSGMIESMTNRGCRKHDLLQRRWVGPGEQGVPLSQWRRSTMPEDTIPTDHHGSHAAPHGQHFRVGPVPSHAQSHLMSDTEQTQIRPPPRPLKLSGRNTDEFSTPSESCMPPSPIHRRSVLSIADS